MRFAKFGISILLLLVFALTLNAQTTVPPTFFGIVFNNYVDYPTIPFGSMRLWDTGTTWAQVEPSNGVYSWTQLDQWLAVAAANDKDVILTFASVPTWASSDPTAYCSGCQYPPADLNSGDYMWKAFITALVNHSLSSPSKHIAYYELWNEPDLLARWSGTPAQLVTMAADAYAIIHALDPTAKVIGPSPSTANKYGVHFLPAYYAAGGAPYQDIVGLHGYVYVVDGNTFATTPENIAVSISELKSLMATYDISSKPIFFTEGSYGNISMTNAQKVAYVAREYLLMWTGGVSRYYWYSWDNNKSFGTMWSAATGVQPVGIAYSQVNNWMSGATVSPCVSTGTVYTCTLTRNAKYKALVVWDTGGASTYDMPLSFTSYRDLAGTSHPLSGSSVTIGPEPIILE